MVAAMQSNNAQSPTNQAADNFSAMLSNLKFSSNTNTNNSNNSTEPGGQYKSKFKTIKVFVASNKYEFQAESEYLLKESQPELQQHFMHFGYDVQFVDLNLNSTHNFLNDPHFCYKLLEEVEECAQVSEAVVFLLLLGNKYGNAILPLELSQAEFQTIRTGAADAGKDVHLLDTWYILDENSSPTVYRLKSVKESFSNIYNRSSDSYENHKTEVEIWEDINKRLLEIIQEHHETAKEFKANQSIKLKIDRFNISPIDLFTQVALKCASSECIIVNRNFDGLSEKSKNCEYLIDIKSGKIDKSKQEKLTKFRESIWNKVNDENKHRFNLEWNDDLIEETYLTNHSDSSGSIAISKNAKSFQKYLQNFNEVIVTKVKSNVEKFINDENMASLKPIETVIYQEATRHMHKFHKLMEKSVFGFDEMSERIKKLINYGSKNEHYPIFIYGGASAGKTLTLTKLSNAAYNAIGARTCITVIRYFDLTSQCSTFEGLLYSICQQLTVLQKLNPVNDMPAKEVSELVQYFQKICAQLAKGQKQVLIVIDGIQDVYVDKNLIAKTNMPNNHLSWLFNVLPAKIHLMVSIKKQLNIVKSENEMKQQPTSPLSSTTSLVMHYYQETLANNKENYLFELPIVLKNDNKELITYIKAELHRNNKSLSDDQIQSIIDAMNLKVSHEVLVPISSMPMTSSNSDSSLLYLHFMLETIKNSHNNKKFLSKDMPTDIESLLKYIIDNLEKIYGSKILSFLFNYITASHNGLTEMEIVDILSCNNDFFFDYYGPTHLPICLRFPVSLWLSVKYELGDLLCQKYMDNKITYCWSYDCVKKLMKQTYFNKVETIRACHKDISNYFLESFVETKPLVDMHKSIQIRDEEGKRFVCQQPLLYSEIMYNYRRLNELWYHLMNSGDIQRLKEHAFFNFEYLLAKCHGISLQNLMNDVDCVLKRILDTDILLLNALLRKSLTILSQDPLKLAYEILSKLRSLQEEYGGHVKALVSQAAEWCESYSAPQLMPLTTWMESPENFLITRIDNPDGILKIAVTSFNQHVFFSTTKNEICMYHVPSKKLVRKFVGHSDVINSLQISYNNRFLVSASSDTLVKVWNLGTGDVEQSFTCNKSAILCAILTHSDEIIITGCKDKLINVIRIDTGELIHSVEKHEDAVTALAISIDDNILISASLDKTVKRWLMKDMELVDNITTIHSPVTGMVMTNDNIFIVVACANSTVQVKSLITGSDIHELCGHSGLVTYLAASNDGQFVYIGCSDSKLYLYDIKSRELIAAIMEQDSSINDLKISMDNSFLFSSSDNSLYVLNLKKQNLRAKKVDNSQNLIKCFHISHEGDVAITGDESGAIKLWNLVIGEMTEVIMDHHKPTTSVCLSHSYLFSVSACSDGSISVFDNEIGEIISEFKEHTSSIKHLHILEDNHKILSADEENHIKVWWANTGELVDSITVPCQLLSCSPDGKYVVSGSGDNTVKIWHLSDAKVVRQIDHPDKITNIEFTYDSTHVITGGDDNSCKIWESSTGKLVQVLIEHEGPITSIAVPEQNNFVVSGSKDKHVIFWNFKDGSVIHKTSNHDDTIVKVAITHDASVFFSASKEGKINVWSSLTGKLLNGIDLNYTIIDMAVASNGSRIICRLAELSDLPIVVLTNKPSSYIENRTLSQMNLKRNEVLESNATQILPIKPKPLLFPKQTTVFRLSTTSYNCKIRKTSAGTDTIHVEPLSTSHTSNGAKDFFKRKKRRKDRSAEFSSTLSIVQNSDEKHKKTKICCLL